MTNVPNRPRVKLLRTLFLWGARWTAGLGLIGIATHGRDGMTWVWTAGIVVALCDLFLTLLKEARLADKRARARSLVSELESRLDGNARSDDK